MRTPTGKPSPGTSACRFVEFTHPQSVFVNLYSAFDPIGAILSNWRMRTVTKHVKPGQLVDLACGDNRLVRRLGRGVGVDVQDFANVDEVCPDFSKLPFDDNSVATVTIMAALNYFDEPKAVMKELHRILAPDGVIVITLLNKRVSHWWHKLRDRGLKRIAYSESEVRDILDGTGLCLIKKHAFMLGLNWVYLVVPETIGDKSGS